MSIAKDFLIKFLVFLKEYGGTLIIVPAVAGGLWQIFKLGSISLSSIRFFSITQVLPDGLLILIFMCIIIIQYGLIFGLNTMAVGIGSIIEDKIWVRKINIWIFKANWDSWIGILTILLLCAGTLVYFGYVQLIVDESDIFLFIFNQLTFLLSLFIVLNYLYNNVSRKYQKFKDNIFIYWGIMTIIFGINLFVKFGNLYSIPSATINIDELNQKINKHHPNSISALKYMNDKYLFFELTTIINNDTIKKYKILEIENLFSSDSLQQNLKK